MDARLFENYRFPDQTKKEVEKVIGYYKSLIPRKDLFIFTDGTRKEFVNLTGTIPVYYQKQTYNIPICIWLMDTFPDNAPLCYLKPTSNMKINISQHVDHCGKIYAPYLHDWSSKSDLLMLIQVLTMLFSEKPPLYSVPAQPTTSAPQQTPPYPTNQPTPYYMPMPSTSNTMSYPYGNHGITPYIKDDQTPYPIRPNPTSLPYPVSQPSYPNPQQSMIQPEPDTGTIKMEHFRASLLSAAEDKVRRNIREQISQLRAELEILEKIHSDLTQGKSQLLNLMSRLESEQSEWEKVLTTLKDKDLELDAALLNISNQGEMNVDEAVVTTAPLYKQLLNAFAEEAATEDAIYYLGEGLRRGVIDLEVFLKHVRSLSRKQFMLRALMHKCRNKAGLAF